ncbi:hypothetical protein B0H13DRAFT_676308 [Mycena leptocephala]|nr:hypothetical protein B0H13DRAFT_676308 [Mycena leptocephala]
MVRMGHHTTELARRKKHTRWSSTLRCEPHHPLSALRPIPSARPSSCLRYPPLDIQSTLLYHVKPLYSGMQLLRVRRGPPCALSVIASNDEMDVDPVITFKVPPRDPRHRVDRRGRPRQERRLPWRGHDTSHGPQANSDEHLRSTPCIAPARGSPSVQCSTTSTSCKTK